MREFRQRDFVGAPATCIGASETIAGDNLTIREIVTRFTSQVIQEEFSNKEFFYDFDINHYVRQDSNGGTSIDFDSFVSVCDRYIPIRQVDIEAASLEQRVNYYRQYIDDAKAYFREQEDLEKARKLAEKEKLSRQTSSDRSSDIRTPSNEDVE